MRGSNQYVKNAVHVSEFNLKCIMHEYQTGERYELPYEDHPDRVLGRKQEEKKQENQIEVIEEGEEEEQTQEGQKKTDEDSNEKKEEIPVEESRGFHVRHTPGMICFQIRSRHLTVCQCP